LPDRKRDLERILRRILQSQPFSGIDIKPPVLRDWQSQQRRAIAVGTTILLRADDGQVHTFVVCRSLRSVFARRIAIRVSEMDCRILMKWQVPAREGK